MKFFMFRYMCIAFLFLNGILSGRSNDTCSLLLQQKDIDPTPYLLPNDHPIKKSLYKIFSQKNVLKDAKSLDSVGFKTLYIGKKGGLRVVSHKSMPGYLFKLYLASDVKNKKFYEEKFLQRCLGAVMLRREIEERKIRYFTVPKKWLYSLPAASRQSGFSYILVVQRLNVLSGRLSKAAWREKITKNHLRELYPLLRLGYGSMFFSKNIPYIGSGVFAFVDLEYPLRVFDLDWAERFFSPEMAQFWRSLQKKSIDNSAILRYTEPN